MSDDDEDAGSRTRKEMDLYATLGGAQSMIDAFICVYLIACASACGVACAAVLPKPFDIITTSPTKTFLLLHSCSLKDSVRWCAAKPPAQSSNASFTSRFLREHFLPRVRFARSHLYCIAL